ncbi:MAG: hypothetical protein LBS96_04985 [Oscillospiraceae bacterium]|nr:hypothetical protein [Oscillospiraceae bacterium]
MKIKILSLLLCLSLLLGVSVVPAAAADPLPLPDTATQFLYDLADSLVKPLIRLIGLLFPAGDLPGKYVSSPDFYPGMDTFLDAPAAGAKWNLGYASASLLEGQNIFDGKHYVGGGLVGDGQTAVIDEKTPTVILDDQRVRVTALNDGSGRGTVILASIDGFGITSKDVRAIRALLADFAKENNIVSINVSALHQHSVIDTLGMNGPLLKAVFLNPVANLTGLFAPYSGKNADFMDNLHNVVANAAKAAFANLEPGTLHYAKVNIKEYIFDKRPPYVFDEFVHRLRFVPDAAASKETWLCNLAIHCTGNGASAREVTGDFPYYMEETVNAAGANFQLIQGAQLAITLDSSPVDALSAVRFEKVQNYGHALGSKLTGITPEQETVVTPLLNAAHKEYSIPIDNPLHMLFFRLKMIDSTAVKSDLLGWNMDLWTEVGYLEIGDALAVAIVPGEMEAALAFGGGLDSDSAWKRTAWEYAPMQETIGAARELLVFGLSNDQVGYMILPNDVHNFILFGNEEVNAASTQAAPAVLKAFEGLVASK